MTSMNPLVGSSLNSSGRSAHQISIQPFNKKKNIQNEMNKVKKVQVHQTCNKLECFKSNSFNKNMIYNDRQ